MMIKRVEHTHTIFLGSSSCRHQKPVQVERSTTDCNGGSSNRGSNSPESFISSWSSRIINGTTTHPRRKSHFLETMTKNRLFQDLGGGLIES
jgi:hypothetical protein